MTALRTDHIFFEDNPNIRAICQARADHIIHVERDTVLQTHSSWRPQLEALRLIVVAHNADVGEPANALTTVPAADSERALLDVHPHANAGWGASVGRLRCHSDEALPKTCAHSANT
mmetsp:Transcript_3335/g.2612  ORF Transcript_3335/g.2612 Transcript_3335/m.2612 type:complete len:117 (-) Transcript_3335:83-433(-)